MDAGALYKLHDTRNKHIHALADGIHLQLFSLDVVVHQHRFVLVDFHGIFQILSQLLFVGNDLHGPAAQHEGRSDQHRITDFRGYLHAVFNVGDSLAFGLGNVQLLQHLLEQITVFGFLDGFTVGADQLDAALH